MQQKQRSCRTPCKIPSLSPKQPGGCRTSSFQWEGALLSLSTPFLPVAHHPHSFPMQRDLLGFLNLAENMGRNYQTLSLTHCFKDSEGRRHQCRFGATHTQNFLRGFTLLLNPAIQFLTLEVLQESHPAFIYYFFFNFSLWINSPQLQWQKTAAARV